MPIDPRIPQCQHIKVNGLRCGSPSLKGRKFCYFHYSVGRHLIRTDIPILEDINSVQYSLNRLAEYILEKRIDYKSASLLLWLMQIASANARHARLEPFLKEDIVREHPDDTYFRNTAFQPSDDPENPDSLIPVSQEDLAALASSGDASAPADAEPSQPQPPKPSSVPSVVKKDSSASSAVNNSRKPPTREEIDAIDQAIDRARRRFPLPASANGSSASTPSSSPSEGHGFNRAATRSAEKRALAPEVSSDSSAASTLRNVPRTPQELEELAVRAIDRFRNTPYTQKEVPTRKRRRKPQ